jgi:hypothetical protein
MSDYTRERWEQIKAMGPRSSGPRNFLHAAEGSGRARMDPVERRRLGAYLHRRNVDWRGGARYTAAPAGYRWHKERLVPRFLKQA